MFLVDEFVSGYLNHDMLDHFNIAKTTTTTKQTKKTQRTKQKHNSISVNKINDIPFCHKCAPYYSSLVVMKIPFPVLQKQVPYVLFYSKMLELMTRCSPMIVQKMQVVQQKCLLSSLTKMKFCW